MSTELSTANMNNGGVIEAMDFALTRIAENIADVNTPPDKVRELIVSIKIKPDQNRTFGNAVVSVKTKLQPEEAQVVSVLMDKKNGKPVLFEAYSDHIPDQNRLPGTMPAEVRDAGKPKNVTSFKTAAQ